ncbi:MAG TPA: phytoene/squalene synthase family protein [Acidocella sp.]|nr:phytoene/squalene synthase family protein [Acidocella sp.]HQU05351.1 phytoene/squalene synthase family protein [Acidocella sp.]
MPQFFADPADIAACQAMLCSGSRSFFAASLLLPRHLREPATALYAFCREADDAIDLGDDPSSALAYLYNRLDAAYEGEPYASPVDRAFAGVVANYQIPKLLPAALIEGLSWDLQGRRYETLADLADYAARVAGAVGVMMALLMGVRDAESLARAADLGVAMQFTNIARDVGEDARAGRLFLPQRWLAEAGIDESALLATPQFSSALGLVVKRLLAEADILYKRAYAGILRLPLDCRIGIAAARKIYAAIGADIAAGGYNSVTRRARVSGYRKLALAASALPMMLISTRQADAVALPATQYLVDAAALPTMEKPNSGVTILLDIFERLERSQREAVRNQRRLA